MAESDVIRVLHRLLRDTRKSGIVVSHELACSEDFFEDFGGRRLLAVGREYASKYAESRTALERELGAAREDDTGAEWVAGGTKVRLELAREDKEMPFVLTLSADHETPLLRDAIAAVACECAKLTVTKDPFLRVDLVLLRDNPSITKTHARVAQSRVNDKPVRLLQCRGCGQLRQTGDAGVQYVFEVPPIAPAEWEREPYVDYLSSKMYEDRLRDYLENADRTTTADECRKPGCTAKAVKLSVFCFDHHAASRQQEAPPGRPLR